MTAWTLLKAPRTFSWSHSSFIQTDCKITRWFQGFLIGVFAGTWLIHAIYPHPVSQSVHCGVSRTSHGLIESDFKRPPFCLAYHLSSRLQLISSQKPFKNLTVPLISLVSWSTPWHQHTHAATQSHPQMCVCVHMHTHTMSSSDFCCLSQVSHRETCKCNQCGCEQKKSKWMYSSSCCPEHEKRLSTCFSLN